MKRNLSAGSLVVGLLLAGLVTHAAAGCEVDIDIKPQSCPNSINLNRRGVIPVAFLSKGCFDATTVNPATVTFGPNHAVPVHAGFCGHIEDVDFDGDMDLLFHFNTQDTGIQPGDTEATMWGQTYGGEDVWGTGPIRTVPPR